MKINKKVMVTTLALAMGAALAGSISGSVAWYQYSTRASAQLAGTSVGTSRNLQIALKPGENETASYSATGNIDLGAKNFRPASLAISSNEAHFYEHPIYKTAAQTLVTPTNNEMVVNSVTTVAYAEFEFVFKCVDDKGGANPEQVAKKVYLSEFALEKDPSAAVDITPAVRVKISDSSDTVKYIIGNEIGVTKTFGTLDLNNNGNQDTDDILVDDEHGNLIYYYAGVSAPDTSANPVTGPQYNTTVASEVKADMSNPYALETNNPASKAFTTTKTDGDSNPVKVQVWIEGWQELDVPNADPAATSQIWDSSYIAQNFELKLQFACTADYE